MANKDDRDRDHDGPGRIKVTDRRNFTTEGERREPDEPPVEHAPMPAMPQPPPGPGPGAAASGSGGRPGASRPGPPRGEAAGPTAAAPGAPAEPGASAEPSIDFVAFVQSLYVSALMALGEVENPYTRQFETNLDLARQNIDILAMLHEKTRGNLTPEEDDFIGQVVPQLQMLYVKKAK